MQFDVPDPAFTGSAVARAHFKPAARIALGFVALLWLVHLMNWVADLDPAPFGIRPHRLAGALGVLTAPLAHADFGHLVANSAPLVVVGTAMLFLDPAAAIAIGVSKPGAAKRRQGALRRDAGSR